MRDFIHRFKVFLALWEAVRSSGTNFLNNKIVSDFEQKLARFLEVKYAVAVASGTDALILSLKTFDIGPGDEVIVPALSFYSSAGAIAWINATPVFVDIEWHSLNIDPEKIEKAVTLRTKAIIAVHLNGRTAQMDKISAIAKKYNLFVIEDAAQAIGAKYKNKNIGYFGDLACISFNSQKIINGIGDGGAIITKSAAFAEKIYLMREYGAAPNERGLRHSIHGVASRLNPFQAALLNLNLETFGEKIYAYRKNHFFYSDLLKNVDGVIMPEVPDEYFINGYRPAILIKPRNKILKLLRDDKIDARIHYETPLHLLGAFSHLEYIKGDFPVAEKAAEEILVLPNSGQMNYADVERIALKIKNILA